METDAERRTRMTRHLVGAAVALLVAGYGLTYVAGVGCASTARLPQASFSFDERPNGELVDVEVTHEDGDLIPARNVLVRNATGSEETQRGPVAVGEHGPTHSWSSLGGETNSNGRVDNGNSIVLTALSPGLGLRIEWWDDERRTEPGWCDVPHTTLDSHTVRGPDGDGG